MLLTDRSLQDESVPNQSGNILEGVSTSCDECSSVGLEISANSKRSAQ
nr:MAG TPA: Repressor of phase-1 flagellin [Caudoviricetes sp.]